MSYRKFFFSNVGELTSHGSVMAFA